MVDVFLRSDHVSKLIAWGLIFAWGMLLGWAFWRVRRWLSGRGGDRG